MAPPLYLITSGPFIGIIEEDKENSPDIANKATEQADTSKDESTIPQKILELLGEDPNNTKELPIVFHSELKIRWEKWIREGFPEEDKKIILQKYPRKKEFFIEAPKINLEIIPVMTEIAKSVMVILLIPKTQWVQP